MSDEPTNDNVEEVIADEPQPELVASEESQVADESAQAVEETEEASPELPQEESEQEAPEERQPSRREQLRIQTLLQKYGDPRSRQAPSQTAPQTRDALDYSTALDADPEVVRQLEADRQRTEQLSYNEGLRRAEAIEFKTNIRLDLPLVSEKLNKLDPRDAEALDKEYLYTVGFDPQTGYVQNPNIGYAEFIEARIDQAERLAQAMSAQTVKNVAKQAAATGLRPDGSSAKRLNLNQAPQSMSIEELYASIGQKPPKQ